MFFQFQNKVVRLNRLENKKVTGNLVITVSLLTSDPVHFFLEVAKKWSGACGVG